MIRPDTFHKRENDTAGGMRPLGLLGGTSWHSTVEYYTRINQMVNDIFGNNTNPPLVLVNLNQKHIHDLQKQDRWDLIAEMLTEAAGKLERAGAEAVLFCANTPHILYDEIAGNISVPILHIADATGNQIVQQGLKTAGLIGTVYTMEKKFIADRLKRFDIKTITPQSAGSRKKIQRIIEEELTFGTCSPGSREFLLAEIALLVEQGAEGIILGCTELPLTLEQKDLPVPAFDTTQLHARMAVDFMLDNSKPFTKKI